MHRFHPSRLPAGAAHEIMGVGRSGSLDGKVMMESPVQGLLKETLGQIADRILRGTNGDISLVCPRLDVSSSRG